MGLAANAQTYTRSGNTFISSTGERDKAVKTKFTWKDSKGREYPVYISSSGSCFVIRVSSKTGKEYKSYLGPEISEQICKELGIEYKNKKGNKV
jgi:hypothetical protein